jgi:hypothetical protein
MTNTYKFIEESKKVELSFSKYLEEPQASTRKQDMHEHWDVQGTLPSLREKGILKFDVKGKKKENRSDKTYMKSSTWVELKNVQGRAGWAYGEADYIAFDRLQDWLLVDRKELLKFTKEKIKSLDFKEGKQLYHVYTRVGKKDVIVKVLFEDLENLKSSKKLSKNPQLELDL